MPMSTPHANDHAALRALLTINRSAQSASPDEVIDLYLEEAIQLTGSTIGFYHFVTEDQRRVRLHTWSRATAEVCQVIEGRPAVPERGAEYPTEEAGVWLDAMRLGHPVIHNDYPTMPDRRGLPEGHVAVTRELVVPVIEDGRVAVLAGVGNSPAPYTDTDAARLALLAENAWLIVQRKRAEEQRELLIAELEQALASVRRLSGLVPICAACKKIRDDTGYWQQVEAFISEHSEAQFSQGVCPDCLKQLGDEV
jgi:GAF domain-containing protein